MTTTTDETIRYTADVVLLAAGHVLLIERGCDPYKGHWALPGGHVDVGETNLAAAAREHDAGTGGSHRPRHPGRMSQRLPC